MIFHTFRNIFVMFDTVLFYTIAGITVLAVAVAYFETRAPQ